LTRMLTVASIRHPVGLSLCRTMVCGDGQFGSNWLGSA
jgi:hypothetical protein